MWSIKGLAKAQFLDKGLEFSAVCHHFGRLDPLNPSCRQQSLLPKKGDPLKTAIDPFPYSGLATHFLGRFERQMPLPIFQLDAVQTLYHTSSRAGGHSSVRTKDNI
ncbi:hypothetical protein L249_6096 [Ophiocordyceps polyrhachis-furcata BCC 54312]|uniref:Uncharacterized protein n=1 Tax=Ophiocordyceps polyrhachis-furcata BCC 54312 TaxID=1330021 RepID=A0A367LJA0_9HYPO|nr:hypothetical protein L249_6096 [Ophiocordyceps polyrhachis-furcata BCC 54312]